jgi:hypothetical protein
MCADADADFEAGFIYSPAQIPLKSAINVGASDPETDDVVIFSNFGR